MLGVISIHKIFDDYYMYIRLEKLLKSNEEER